MHPARLRAAAAALACALLAGGATSARAQQSAGDSARARGEPRRQPDAAPPSPLRLRLRRDSLRLEVPPALLPLGRLSDRPDPSEMVAAQWAGAVMRETAGRAAALWGQSIAQTFGTVALPDSAGAIQAIATFPPPPDSAARARADSSRGGDLLAQYSDIGLQLDTRIEAKAERNKNERCTATDLLVPTSNCRGSYQPQFDFQFNVKTGGTVADRVHVNVDYDSEREFDASNNINVYYEGKPDEILHRLEVGNVSFVPPPSRFITSGIPAGNYGLQATGQLGPMTFRTILAQQKGNVVKDRVFTIGDRTVQGVDRDIEDYQVERRRFFWVVDPAREFPDVFPNLDVLDANQLATLVQRLPPDRRPRRVLVYRYRPPSATAAGGSRDINGPYAVTLGAHNRNEIGPYEVLQQGVDYYIDPSNLWISLVTPIVRGERLAVSYTVTGAGGAETTVGSVGGTLPTQRGAAGADTVVLLWDNDVLPGDSAFTREMRNVYRLGGEDIERGSVQLKIVVGSGSDQERSQGPGAPTYLQLFGLAQPTNPSAFDAVNRLWPRDADPNLATNAGGGSAKLIRDFFVVFPSLRPFADSGMVDLPDPVNDSLYRTPDEDLFSQRRPPTQYRLHVRYQSRGGGDFGTLALGSVQIRQGSENLSIGGVPLRRDVDYRVDYELGQVTFLRPDTLFAQPRQVTVRYEENPLFATAPTSIFGLATEFPLANNGRLGFTVISQSQRTTFNRPPLGFEPASALVAGVNGTFNWEAAPLTRMLDRIPGVTATAPSYVSLQGEFATSRPQPNSAGSAYVESFEGEGGVPVSLAEASWRIGSQPAISGTGAKIGATTFDFDTAAAATLAWQNLGYAVDSLTGARTPIQFFPDQIDPLITFTGRSAFRVPEQLLWLTLFPRNVGGFWCGDCSPPRWQWTLPGRAGRRWRSLSQSLGTSGVDLTRVEQLEFWALVDTSLVARRKNPAFVFDFGDVSENSVSFAPETLTVRTVTRTLPGGGTRTVVDSTWGGRQLQGFDRLDTERDELTKAFDVSTNDTGLPGDVADPLVKVDADRGTTEVLHEVPLCARGGDVLLDLGDPRADCTVANRRLDEEDLDLDGFLNLTSASRNAESILRYTVDLSDPATYNRVGSCFRSAGDTLPQSAGGTVCWVNVRVPFTVPTESLNNPLIRRVKSLRLTMVSSPAAGDDELTRVPIARLRLVGSPWVKRAERAIAGVGGAQAQGNGYVIASVVGTQDRDASGLLYESPPGVVDEADDQSSDFQLGAVQINERSLRLVAGDVPLMSRAEAFYRFPEGDKNFMAYRELRVWARGRNKGWGPQGDLQFYIKVGRDQDNFYLYRTPVNAGPGRDAWLPEVRVEFERFYALRAQVQNNFLRGGARIACQGLDSALVAASDSLTGGQRYAACADGYIVYSANPGVSPPNLAAVQELAVGMVRVAEAGAGTGGPILATDSLELWVDDIRLTSTVNDPGYAGQVALDIGASDIGRLQLTVSRRDQNFRQLAEQPSYLTDDQLGLAASFRLDRFLPASFGWVMPATVSFTSSATDPFFLSRSDVRANGVQGLRTPRSRATSWTLSMRRATPVKTPVLGLLLNNLGLNTTYSTASSRSEYSVGGSSSFTGSLDWNLVSEARTARLPWLDRLVGALPGWLAGAPGIRSLRGMEVRWNPTQLRLTSSYAHGTDRRESFLAPVELDADDGRLVRGLNDLLRNAAALEMRPFPSLTARLDIATLRDMRDYGDTTLAGGGQGIGSVARAERDRFLGVDVGLERERQMGMVVSYAPALLSWLRPRVDFGTQYGMLRDPNSQRLLQAEDSTGAFRLPRRLTNSQGLGLGASVDLARSLPPGGGILGLLGRLTSRVQPLDIAWRRDLRSAFDGVAFDPGLSYQLALGGPGDFREVDGVLATTAGVTRTLNVNGGLNLPLGAVLVARYSSANSTAWTRRLAAQSVLETEQVTFPDLSLRWSFRPALIGDILSSVGVQAGVRRTEGSTFQPTVGEGGTTSGFGPGVRDEVASTQYTITPSLTWAGLGGLSMAGGWSRTDRTRVRSGGRTVGGQTDLTGTLGRSFHLPVSWNLGTDLRWSLGYTQSRAQEFFDASGAHKRVTDNGRWGINTNADTDVSETMTFSLTFARNVNFDNLYDRHFTQTVFTATLHLRFFAGELR